MNILKGEYKIFQDEIRIQTKGYCDIHDITTIVEQKIAQSGIQHGQVLTFIPGATAGITTTEYEPGLIKDLPEFFEKIIPSDKPYHHDQTWHDGNGFSHLRASLLKPSLVVPVQNGHLQLGTWQQIIVIDFDNRSRDRKIIIQVSGI